MVISCAISRGYAPSEVLQPPLVSCPANKFAYLFDLFEDGISGCCPHERSGMFIVMSNEFFDLGDELFCAAKRVSADRLFGDMPKPPLHLVEP